MQTGIRKKVAVMPFFIIFVLIPLSELFVFMNVSEHIGLGTALLMALLTAILGGVIVRYQGISTLMSAQASLQRGSMPSKELFDGLCIVAAGATLITPGFITDAVGFALLIPPIRDALRTKLSKNARFTMSGFGAEHSEFHDAHRQNHPSDPNVIDVEYETVDEQEIKKD